MKIIDSFLNRITMYRLTFYYLIGLIVAAVWLSVINVLPYSPYDIVINTGIALVFCYAANFIFAKLFRAVTNTESVFITAFILVLIIPVKFPLNATFFMLASVLAMGSKYLLTIEKRHLFNPAAAAVAGISLLSSEHSATWWVGTSSMAPFVLIGGLLLVRKIQREQLVFVFLSVYLLIVGLFTLLHSGILSSVFPAWETSIFRSALLFFTFVMLTEPLTSPQRKKLQNYYAILTSILYASPQIRVFSLAFTPEIALCIGNIFSYIVSSKYRLVLPLREIKQLSSDIYAFIFDHDKKFAFVPGQYMEWTLSHPHADSRGNRRYFSIASSPSEDNIMMAVRFYNPSSSYKKALINMQQGQEIIASQLAGDFVLPKKLDSPLVFIAGGVGIAPFRSMVQFILDNNLSVNIIIIYSNRKAEDIVFADVFEKARNNGVKTIYVLTDTQSVPINWQGRTGYIDEKIIQEEIPDYDKRVFYISGPQLMVQRFEKILTNAGVEKKNIRTDFFPGYLEQ